MTSRAKHQEKLPPAADFFRGKDILITGASGFLGKTLINKILREAPDVGTIFMLLRPKKGCTPQNRLQSITNVNLFTRLRAQQPNALDKLHVVAGDVQELGLGLSPEDVAMLRDRVQIVFHIAASVRFDDPLRKALILNLRGTREICELAKGMTKLQVMIHVSTAFCNIDRRVNEEKLGSPPGDWRVMMNVAEQYDDFTLQSLSEKIIGKHANTYIYSKSLAEHVIDYYKDEIPLAIIRPSMVISTYRDPCCGWVDNLYGPMGPAMASMAGLISANFQPRDSVIDSIPVDVLINGLILLTIHRGQEKEKGILPIVNGTMHGKTLWNFREARKYLTILHYEPPIDPIYKHLDVSVNSEFLFYLVFMLINVSVSSVYDVLLRFQGQKISMLHIHRKLLTAALKFFPFLKNNFDFPNDKFTQLYDRVSPEDTLAFEINMDVIPKVPYQMHLMSGLKKLYPQLICANPIRKFLILEIVHYPIVCFLLWTIWKLQIPSFIARILFSIGKFMAMGTAL